LVLRRDHLDVGKPQPACVVETDDRQSMGGQHAVELGGNADATAPPQRRDGHGSAVAGGGEDVGEDHHGAGGEHPADLGDPGRPIRPVPHGHGGEDQVEQLVGERQLLGTGVHVADRQLRWGRGDGGLQHPPGQVDADQLGSGIPLPCMPQEPSSATPDVKHPLWSRQEPLRELQDGLVDRNEQDRLQRAVLVGARPPVESGRHPPS
jgi:hypothetical protein